MDTIQRTTQNDPSYSPRQMSQGDSATSQAQRPDEPDRQRRAHQAEARGEADSREWDAYLGED